MFFTLVINYRLYNTTQRTILIDLKLIEECRGGNLNNFRRLVEATSPFAFSVAFRMLGDEDQAKDVVQETMITIWQKLGKIKTSETYKTWIYRIVVNKCYDQLRLRKRKQEYTADEKTWTLISEKISVEPLTELDNTEIAGVIKLLTNRLSPKQKAVFILSDLEQMSNDEISVITGMSKSGIKSNLHYARKSISEMLERYL
jgi:RNA polymerase sigma-70 factor, ECF subfamily